MIQAAQAGTGTDLILKNKDDEQVLIWPKPHFDKLARDILHNHIRLLADMTRR